jgi:hypothetical protein
MTLDNEYRQGEAIAELLKMRLISPLGEPIQDIVHQAVVSGIERYHRACGKDYSLFNVAVHGVEKWELDRLLLKENPAAVMPVVIRMWGSNMEPHGGEMSRRNPDRMPHDNADWSKTGRVLLGTRFWNDALKAAIGSVIESSKRNHSDLLLVAFGAKGSELVGILERVFARKRGDNQSRHISVLAQALDKRGWRLRLRGRQIEVLRRGQEEPRADADFGY